MLPNEIRIAIVFIFLIGVILGWTLKVVVG